MTIDNLELQIKYFIVDQTSSDYNKLNIQTSLRQDLGIDGDDAVDFFSRFSEKFNVDLSAFEIDKYFGPEALFGPLVIFQHVKYQKDAVITIEHLIKVAKARTWLEL